MQNERKRIFIITGMSGAGKSQALKMFGDLGFYCVDNLPLALFENFISYVRQNPDTSNIALGIDIREGSSLQQMPKLIKSLAKAYFSVKVIFLNASDECLIRRFSETKHKHPIHQKLVTAIDHERKVMEPMLRLADEIIDTSNLKLGELKEKLSSLLSLKRAGEMQISVMSFGFKYGLPKECDIVMDVRFLPNPYYVPELKEKNGLDPAVQKYIMSFDESYEFVEKFADLIKFLLPKYIKEGKSYLTIAMGCTGGRHRSVFMAHKLAEDIKKLRLIKIETAYMAGDTITVRDLTEKIGKPAGEDFVTFAVTTISSVQQEAEKLQKALAACPEGAVVLTDIFGGSATNISLTATKDLPNCHVITGLNLSMLLTAINSRKKLSAKELAEKIEADGKRAVINATELLIKGL